MFRSIEKDVVKEQHTRSKKNRTISTLTISYQENERGQRRAGERHKQNIDADIISLKQLSIIVEKTVNKHMGRLCNPDIDIQFYKL